MPIRFLIFFTLIAVVAITVSYAVEDQIKIGEFSQKDLTGWDRETFKGETTYTLVNKSGRSVLKAVSRSSASGLYKKVSIDLTQTPFLNWSWKTRQILESVNERTRQGDDYPARVYVVFSGGLFFWRTRAINYVWANQQPVGSHWPNPFTSNAQMVAIRSGNENIGKWISERRNVLEDYRKIFGEEPGQVDAVAIMTDTDNSGLSATSWYGDIWFSTK